MSEKNGTTYVEALADRSPKGKPRYGRVVHTFEADQAESVRRTIDDSMRAFMKTCFIQLDKRDVPKSLSHQQRAEFAANIKNALSDGRLCLSNSLPGHGYHRIDLERFTGDKEMAREVLCHFFQAQRMDHANHNGYVLFEVGVAETERLKAFMEALELKRAALRDFGR